MIARAAYICAAAKSIASEAASDKDAKCESR